MYYSLFFDLYSFFAPPPTTLSVADTSSLTTVQTVTGAIFAAILGYLIRLWITKPLEQAGEYKEAEILKLKKEVSDLNEWRHKMDARVEQTSSGINHLQEQIQDVKETMGAIDKAMRSMESSLVRITTWIEIQGVNITKKPPRTG